MTAPVILSDVDLYFLLRAHGVGHRAAWRVCEAARDANAVWHNERYSDVVRAATGSDS